MRHESAARFVSDYDVNNAYQYIISREETHVSWLQHALLDLGARVPADPAHPDVRPTRKGNDAVLELAGNDARANQRVRRQVARSRSTASPTPATRACCEVMLGEMLEHQRLFEQASRGSHRHHRHGAADQRAARQSPRSALDRVGSAG